MTISERLNNVLNRIERNREDEEGFDEVYKSLLEEIRMEEQAGDNQLPHYLERLKRTQTRVAERHLHMRERYKGKSPGSYEKFIEDFYKTVENTLRLQGFDRNRY